MRRAIAVVLALGALVVAPVSALASPVAHASATCDDYPNQAAAQRAADTRDADGDGIYCESLPCPCLKPGAGGGGGSGGSDEAEQRRKARERQRARARARARTRERARKRAARRRDERRRRRIEARDWHVKQVVDGDTIDVTDGTGTVRVRLLGIDSPETKKPGTPIECGGPEATSQMFAYTFPAPQDTNADGLLDADGEHDGVDVGVLTDRSQDLYDRYHRLLAYVTVESPPQGPASVPFDLNKAMLRSGWATVYVFKKDFRRIDSYADAETAAQDASAGVYGKCGGDFHRPAS
jgi:micrococcal nuclease